jgi:di/tricarboxylate transporter
VLSAVLVLLVTRVISTEQALAGFANPALATVAALYVLARAMQRSDALGPALRVIIGRGAVWRVELARLLVASAGISAFVNNTPIVAMLAPSVTEYADNRKVAPSRYLLPMVYAVSLGGTITLIGTSTNLVVSGLMTAAKMAPLGMFELTPLGIPVALVGVAMMILTAPLLLIDRQSARSALASAARDFAVSLTVIPGGPLDAKTVEAAGLRHLRGVFLVEIDRAGELVSPVGPDTLLAGGDQLIFVGRADDIVDLERINGLSSSEHSHLAAFDPSRHAFFEAVLGPGSPLVGKTLKEVGFRARYQGAVVAIHRGGERLRAKLGSVRLRATDTLLFMADPGFHRNDFLVVTRIASSAERRRRRKGRWVGLLFVAVALLAGTGAIPLLQATLLAATAVIGLKMLTTSEVREAVDLDVLFVVAGSFALGAAVDTSGLGRLVGDGLVALAQPFGARGALLGVTLMSVVFAQVFTCNTAAAVSFPLAVAVARRLGLDPRPLLIAITVGASSTYLTPLGYQTKMMVYGPGGYRFGDYFRLGAPVSIAVVATVVLLVPIWWPF